MGIARFFANIVKKNPSVYNSKKPNIVNNFFIDFNAMVYKAIILFETDLKSAKNIKDYEAELIKKTSTYLIDIIKNVSPTKLVFIAMDGPVPRAKMIQQRNRRYKSLVEQDFKKVLEKKYNIKITNKWSSSSISPGTVFMSKLSAMLKSELLKNFKELEIVFSDSSVPGEGEHKILPILKNTISNETSIIYSPDADLIVLSVMSEIPNVFIMRDNPDILDPRHIYLSIDSCKEKFFEEITTDYYSSIDKKRILLDYSFLTFMCGNDFVTAPHFLKIKEGGLDILLDCYKKNFDGEFLITGSKAINMEFFKKIIGLLKELEQKEHQKFQKKMHHVRKGLSPKKAYDESLQEWQVELIKFQHLEYYNPEHPLFETFAKVFDCINYFDADWITQYNKFFSIDKTCPEEYMKSLVYNLKYYTSPVENWTYFYKFRAAPTFSDLLEYLESANLNYQFEKNEPFTPLEQLLLILPQDSFFLVPRKLSDAVKNSKLLDFYPTKFRMNILHGHKFIYTDPILPEINTDLIKQIVSVQNFSSVEKGLNKIN